MSIKLERKKRDSIKKKTVASKEGLPSLNINDMRQRKDLKMRQRFKTIFGNEAGAPPSSDARERKQIASLVAGASKMGLYKKPKAKKETIFEKNQKKRDFSK